MEDQEIYETTAKSKKEVNPEKDKIPQIAIKPLDYDYYSDLRNMMEFVHQIADIDIGIALKEPILLAIVRHARLLVRKGPCTHKRSNGSSAYIVKSRVGNIKTVYCPMCGEVTSALIEEE